MFHPPTGMFSRERTPERAATRTLFSGIPRLVKGERQARRSDILHKDHDSDVSARMA
jgi:hypothetical protein